MTKNKILIVDDSEVLLKALELKLSSLGYEPLLAQDGAAAVSAARQHKPDLIVLDLSFPPDVAHGGGVSWDGFLILAWIRRMEELQNTPVIFMSNDASEALQNRARDAGAFGFFPKGAQVEQLVEFIQEALPLTAPETV